MPVSFLCYCMVRLISTLQPALELLAFSYHSVSPTLICARYWLTTSLHHLLGPHQGHGSDSQPNRIDFGSLLPGYNQRLFFVKYVRDISVEKVIRRDTSVWMREESL